jgi:hypothetical protein
MQAFRFFIFTNRVVNRSHDVLQFRLERKLVGQIPINPDACTIHDLNQQRSIPRSRSEWICSGKHAGEKLGYLLALERFVLCSCLFAFGYFA